MRQSAGHPKWGWSADQQWTIPAYLIPAIAVAVPFLTVGYFILAERASMSFERLQPRLCSMYDPYYWRHERYWKLNASPFWHCFQARP